MASPPIKRKHRIAIKTKTRKEYNGRKGGRYSEMKTFIISMKRLGRCGIESGRSGRRRLSIFRHILRKYKLKHSQFAHDLRRETEWFQSTEGEFLALFAYEGRKQNLHEKMWRSVPKMFRDRESVIRTVDSLEGEDMDFYRARMRLKRGIDSM